MEALKQFKFQNNLPAIIEHRIKKHLLTKINFSELNSQETLMNELPRDLKD